jgi:hypothetical protein
MQKLLEIEGNYTVNLSEKRFTMLVYAPEATPDGDYGDYYCKVVAPDLSYEPRDIFGGTPRQAVELACELIKAELRLLVAPQFRGDNGEDSDHAIENE